MLLRRVRGELGSVDLRFRCDGPAVRREMDIRISANASGRFVFFAARLRAEEPREVFQPLLAAPTPRSAETVTMCGWCDRFLVDDEWVEVEEAVSRLGLFELPRMPAIGHGVCPDCSEMLMAA
jgi:hypothetical protein